MFYKIWYYMQYQTRMLTWNIEMEKKLLTKNKQDLFVKHNANSKDGQDHKDIYFDTSRKILSQEMTLCNMEALIFIF